MILGTAAYMAPEQARGKAVDKRADIWAFGVVLYEMLTGRRAFEGEDISDTLASVLKTEPDWNALAPATPSAIRRLLRRCLEKDRKRRLRDIGDARLEIEEALTGAPVVEGAAAQRRAGRATVSAWHARCRGRSPPRSASRSSPRCWLWAPWRSAPVPAPRKLLASIGADASLPTDVWRVGHSVARRDDARVCRAAGGPDAALRPQARSVAGRRPRRHRGRGQPVLLARRPVDRVLRRRPS